MRAKGFVIAAFALAACDSQNAPSPAERPDDRTGVSDQAVPSGVTLGSDSLSVGGEAFYFAAGQTEVEAALARLLGKASDSGEMAECGAGPMWSSTYAGGLTVNFQNGALAGWLLDEQGGETALENGIAIGAPRAEVERMSGFAMIEDSALGEEFVVGDELAGFFEDGKVSMLYSGLQCFFR
ncbi:aspartate-semialdehyde dehydrogenase [Qipengyuania sp. ASV99]|uniref:aspartate-semialdehyde dehydrogenase n=1 Tax=Qipengyuania sp. ASV99 TaxID=3399681 RepID=UPI003A4C534A